MMNDEPRVIVHGIAVLGDLNSMLANYGMSVSPTAPPTDTIAMQVVYHPTECDQFYAADLIERDRCLCDNFPDYALSKGIDCSPYTPIYWYHPDYIGNVEFVTDRTGQPYQHFYYAAFGDPMVSQHVGTGSFNSAFRFNAKEYDEETGNYYYGARYYEPKSSVWMGVDPESTRDPHMTPYHFVYNNPVMFIDPNGLHGYKVDGDGNINRIEDTGGETYGGDEYDVVFKADTYKPGQSEGDGYRVNDNSILSQLSNRRTDSKGYRVRYSKNSSGEETFGLFIYLAHNTDVEWTMIGTRDGENENFVLGTRQFESNGFNPKLVGYSEMNETFNLHSHPRTPGASGFGYNKIFGDRRYVGEKTKRLMDQGQAAPPHFIYHKPTQQFHQYTPAQKSLGPFRVNSLSQLRRNVK